METRPVTREDLLQEVLNLEVDFTAEGVRREDGKTAAEVRQEQALAKTTEDK